MVAMSPGMASRRMTTVPLAALASRTTPGGVNTPWFTAAGVVPGLANRTDHSFNRQKLNNDPVPGLR